MISKAVVKHVRISPRKARLVLDLVRQKAAINALAILKSSNKKAAGLVSKLLNSAIANAKRLPHIQTEDLFISKIFADGGPVLKRYKAQAMGRASTIRKRTSSITIELDTLTAGLPVTKAKQPSQKQKPQQEKGDVKKIKESKETKERKKSGA